MNTERKKAYNRAYYYAHKEEQKVHDRAYRQAHREEEKAYHKRRYLELKTEILTYYGNGKLACVVCGETRLPCLSIDHTKGGGSQHRKSLGLTAGYSFYLWLKKQGFPEGYHTLCLNCQGIKKAENKEYRCV